MERKILVNIQFINEKLYLKLFTRYLRKIGIVIEGVPKFINNDVYFDGNDYGKIKLGNNITISREVMFLTHDYSLTTACAALGNIISKNEGELYFSQTIIIGDNCFIGARASILPGTTIGDNVIVGAGCVVKGEVSSNSIIVGNPWKKVGNTSEWAEKKINENLFFIENR